MELISDRCMLRMASWLEAWQVYIPLWESARGVRCSWLVTAILLLLCVTTMPAALSTAVLPFNQVMLGEGKPLAWQEMVTLLPAIRSTQGAGWSVIRTGAGMRVEPWDIKDSHDKLNDISLN